MKIGRNDPCICGSGLKFKKCCIDKPELNPKFGALRVASKNILIGTENDDAIINTYFAMLEYVDKESWEGACHATSAIMHVLLTEQGINSVPCIGEVKNKHGYFDHSWIEINSQVYDVAITKPLISSASSDPVFASMNLRTSSPTEVEYGIKYGGLDSTANAIMSIPFVEYMNGFRGVPNGLFGIAKKIATKIDADFNFNIESAKEKHRNTQWSIR